MLVESIETMTEEKTLSVLKNDFAKLEKEQIEKLYLDLKDTEDKAKFRCYFSYFKVANGL